MTRFGITKMLHRWGLSYTCPTYEACGPSKTTKISRKSQGLKNVSKE
ncbi:hypothetical protein [Parageobacillus thermantarcticus]